MQLAVLRETLDGFDILAISYVAPVIGAAWKLPKEAFGPIFAAHYIGAAAGAVFFGWYADRYGRRMGVIIPTAIFGFFALLTIYAYDFRSLFIFRILIGIALIAYVTPVFFRVPLRFTVEVFC